MASFMFSFLFYWLGLSSIWMGKTKAAKKVVCERLRIPLCENIGYNMTTMPNRMGNEDQLEAKSKIEDFRPLIKVGCARHIKHFICSVFAPMCNEDVDYPIVACRSMCEEARKGCEAVMKRFGYPWPDGFKCKSFPVSNQGKICIRNPRLETDAPNPNTKAVPTVSTPRLMVSGGDKDIKSKPTQDATVHSGIKNPTVLPGNCANYKKFVYVEKKERCAAKCGEDVYFDKANKQFSDVWLLIWSTICFVSTMVTVLTYLVDRSRFKYPERPIIYLAFCYNLYSAAYLIRLIAKPEGISCSADGDHLIIDGLNTAGCSIVFLLLYYFGMASSLWWVLLTLTWFLSAALKWSQEAIANKSTYFHAVAWVIPAIQTITALSTRKVDADELTGLCYVGNQNVESLAGFVLAPLCIYLVVGTTFLLAGFISLFRIRSVLKDRDTNTRKLEKLMVRIGVFSVLYTLPATAVIACFVYEYSNMESWQKDVETNCMKAVTDECNLATKPKEEIYMVRHFMSLVVGITSGMWVWTLKTCQSWQLCYYKNFAKNSQRKPIKQQPLLVQISTEKNIQSRTPIPDYPELCGTSNASHPLSNLSCPTIENGQHLSAPV
uniref:Frizzled 3 n=1 Tax=Corallium rubrum TaxID=142104 RepID=A0A0B5ABR5_9CNID|nr:frizzled 3 [Corallium rubrum]